MPKKKPKVFRDKNHTLVIEVRRDKKKSLFTFYLSCGFEGVAIASMPTRQFDKTFTPTPGDLLGHTAGLFVGYATRLGGTPEAMEALDIYIDVSEREKTMAQAQNQVKIDIVEKAAYKLLKKSQKKASKKKVALKKKAEVTSRKKVSKGRGRVSAATLFRELILAGDFTDKEILARVQKKFVGTTTAPSYYRTQLRKSGFDPPVPKRMKKVS